VWGFVWDLPAKGSCIFFSRGSVFYVYATGTSASAEGFVAYAATGDLAGDSHTLKLHYTFCLVVRSVI